jgi:hypothetical protein
LDRVYLTIVNNPFDPIKDREQRSFLYDPIPIGAYIKKANIVTFPGDELNIVYGGRPLTKEEIDSVIPMPGDRFVAIPMVAGGGGEDTQKQVLSVVAMVALMYVGGIGGAALFGEGTTGAAVFAAGVQMVGGYLINNYMQKRLKQDDQGDKTYGWEITTNMVPGGAIPETCGTVRTGGTCISYHVTCDGDKQYANILLDGGIGPLDIDETTGEVTGIDINSILINNEPFANYNGQNSTLPEVYIRPGTNDQEIIPNFGDIFDTQAFGDELKVGDEYVTHEINSDGAKGLEVTFLCPKGLYRLDGSSYETANILLDIQYCKFGETEWRSFPVSTGSQYIQYDASPVIGSGPHGNPTPPKAVVIKGDCRANFSVGMQVLVFSTKDPEYETITEIAYDNSQTHITFDSLIPWKTYAIGYMASTTGQLMLEGSTPRAFRKSFRIDNIPQGQYYVRSKCLFKSGSDTDQKYAVQIFWESLSYIIYDDFCYPNHILLGIKALASDKLSGSISNITWIQSVSKCWVWNPNTQAYEQKDKTNPAWRAYDIYHQAQRLKNINTGEYEMIVRGEAAHKINYPQFERWANFCDAYGLKCNYIHDKTVTRSEALAPIHLVGRGRTFQSGTQISCDFDVPVFEPTQVFTAADVCAGGITYEYINTRDRANAVEVKFRDAARNYEWHTFPIYGEEYESDTGVQNPTQITLDACTDYTQAYRHGMYELKVNAGILRSASFTAELKSLGCAVGDVIGLVNELPKWGTGGSILEVGDNWIKIDKTVTFEAGKSYYVTYRLSNDDVVKQGVSSTSAQRLVMQFGMAAQGQGDGTTNILQVSEPFVEDTEVAVKVDGTHFEVNGDQTVTFFNGLSLVLEFGYGETNVVTVISSTYTSVTDKTIVEIAGLVPDNLETVRYGFTKPRPDDVYAFGEEKKMYKLFKITSISLDGEQRRKISALEHIPEVYQDGADIPPEIDYDNSQRTITVIANENINKLSGKVYLNVSWTPTKQYNGALVLIDGKKVYTAKMSETSYTMEAISLKEYDITVKPLDLFGVPNAEGTIKYTVKYDEPPFPQTEITTQLLNGRYVCIM